MYTFEFLARLNHIEDYAAPLKTIVSPVFSLIERGYGVIEAGMKQSSRNVTLVLPTFELDPDLSHCA